MADVAIIVPVLRRPHRPALVAEDLFLSMRKLDYELLFVASPGDKEEIEALEKAGLKYVVTERALKRGDYPAKINLGYRSTTAEWIFTGADDLHFHPGWFEEAMKFDRPGIDVIGTNDLGNVRVMNGSHSTHSLFRRPYARERGTVTEVNCIYHWAYWHEGCDDEAVQTAMYRGVYAFAEKSHVEHMHPNWGKAPTDELYESHKSSRLHAGRALYTRRKHLWGKR